MCARAALQRRPLQAWTGRWASSAGLPGAPPGLRKPSTREGGVSTVARPCTAKGRMGGEVAARTSPGSRFAAFAYKDCSCQRMHRQIQTIWAAAKLPTAPLFAPPVSPLA